MKRFIEMTGALCAAVLAMPVFAGAVTAKVTWVQVYPTSDVVYVRTEQAPSGQPSCAVHPNVYFAFSLASTRGKETLTTLLMAKATGGITNIVGTGTCTWHTQVENVQYVVLQ